MQTPPMRRPSWGRAQLLVARRAFLNSSALTPQWEHSGAFSGIALPQTLQYTLSPHLFPAF